MKKYFYTNGKDKEGPFSLDELKNVELTSSTLIWYEGLPDWTPAIELEEFKVILELLPPPITNIEDDKSEEVFSDSIYKNNSKSTKNFLPLGQKEASNFWIIAGFILALLGGYIGLSIGANYAFGKYNSQTKRLGWLMMLISLFSIGIWKSMRKH